MSGQAGGSSLSGSTTAILLSNGQQLDYVVKPTDHEQEISRIIAKLRKHLKYHVQSGLNGFGSAKEPLKYIPFTYASSSDKAQQVDSINKVIELVSEFYEEEHGLEGREAREVG